MQAAKHVLLSIASYYHAQELTQRAKKWLAKSPGPLMNTVRNNHEKKGTLSQSRRLILVHRAGASHMPVFLRLASPLLLTVALGLLRRVDSLSCSTELSQLEELGHCGTRVRVRRIQYYHWHCPEGAMGSTVVPGASILSTSTRGSHLHS